MAKNLTADALNHSMMDEKQESGRDIIGDFLASKSGNSLGTVDTYMWYLRGYLKWNGGGGIDRESYDRYILHLKGLHRRPNGIATAATVLREYADFLGVDTKGWQKPHRQDVVTEYLRSNEIEMIRTAIQKTDSNERNLFIFDFLLNTGLRVTELLKLKWSDLDLTGIDTVVEGSEGAAGVVMTCNIRGAKGNKSRIIRLNVGAGRAAMRYARYLFGENIRPEKLRLKPSRVLDLTTKEAIEWILSHVASLAGLDTIGLHPHMLRHTFGVMATKGRMMSERQLQMHLGHSSILTTQRYQQFADLEDTGMYAVTDFTSANSSRQPPGLNKGSNVFASADFSHGQGKKRNRHATAVR
jgi:integrase